MCADSDATRLVDPAEIDTIAAALADALTALAQDLGADSDDPRIRTVSRVANKALSAAHRSGRSANEATRNLQTIRRIVRLGTWRVVLADKLASWSDEMHDFCGTDPRQFVPSFDAMLQCVAPVDRASFKQAFHSAATGQRNVSIELRARRPDGTNRWFWLDMWPEHDESGVPFAVQGLCREITDSKAAFERIRYMASHDSVTGLMNRASLTRRLDLVLEQARRRRESVALLSFDLDDFKDIKDLFGHSMGDHVLRAVAGRMRRHVRGSDLVAAIGSDEFVVVQINGRQPESAEHLARRLLKALAEPIILPNGREIAISASVGIALYPFDGDSPDALLAHAVQAVHAGKSQSRNHFTFYDPSMESDWQRRCELEQSLRLALQRDEFSLVYQPIFCMHRSSSKGFEALLRWSSPTHGAVPPDLFIGVAESIGLMEELGTWVLRNACAEAARWTTPLTVAVNVSPIQIQQGDLATTITQILADTRLAPQRLEIEVTESLLIRSPDRAIDTLRRIKALGVRIAIDDFGTGYSSLATLRAFPFDKLKVDRSFVRDLGENSESLAIIKAVLGLGRGLRLPVVVEGVETEGQAAILRRCGVDTIQGYLISRPMPITCFSQITDPVERRILAAASS